MSDEVLKNMEDFMLGKQESSKTGKPCRACTDFKSWTKKMIGTRTNKDQREQSETANEKESVTTSSECPLDKDELGRSTWDFLHTMAAYYPEEPSHKQEKDMKQFIGLFSKFYPCDHCAVHLRARLKTDTPNTTDNVSLSKWFCDVHNEVNVRLGKSVFDCSKVMERWKDGWQDGSCD